MLNAATRAGGAAGVRLMVSFRDPSPSLGGSRARANTKKLTARGLNAVEPSAPNSCLLGCVATQRPAVDRTELMNQIVARALKNSSEDIENTLNKSAFGRTTLSKR